MVEWGYDRKLVPRPQGKHHVPSQGCPMVLVDEWLLQCPFFIDVCDLCCNCFYLYVLLPSNCGLGIINFSLVSRVVQDLISWEQLIFILVYNKST